MKHFIFFIYLILLGFSSHAENISVCFLDENLCVVEQENLPDSISIDSNSFSENYVVQTTSRPNPLLKWIQHRQRLNKKITAVVLAFPFPFGIVGLHRIYLGTKPYVPVVYIATVGGVFGILPFIDFCVLVFDKDFDRYQNNSKVFMWIKNE